MIISTSFDFGKALCFPSDVKVIFRVESSLEELMFVPDLRKAIADEIVPHLKRLKMSDRSIQREINRILYSGQLFDKLPYPYYMSAGGYEIKSQEDKYVSYSIQDLLEGKVPDLSVESLNLT